MDNLERGRLFGNKVTPRAQRVPRHVLLLQGGEPEGGEDYPAGRVRGGAGKAEAPKSGARNDGGVKRVVYGHPPLDGGRDDVGVIDLGGLTVFFPSNVLLHDLVI